MATRPPYGYAMQYTPTPPPKPKPKSKPAAGAAPVSPLQALLNSLSQGPKERTDAQWAELLDPRMKPFTDSIEAATLNNRARSEYMYETQKQAAESMRNGFLGILTGGKPGAEGEQYSKEHFGGSYLGAQAMSQAADHLRELTSDWDEREWAISGDYLKAMQEIPGIREQMRADVEKADGDEYERKFKYTTLLLDETYRQQQIQQADADRKQNAALEREKLAEARRVFDRQAGLIGYSERKDAVGEARTLTDDTGFVYVVKRAKDGSWVPQETKRKKANQGKPSSRTGPANQEFITVDGQVVKNPNYKPPQPGGPNGKLSDAQEAEKNLTGRVLTSERERILGKIDPEFPEEGPKGRMSYRKAYDYLYSLAEAELGPYGRKHPYIARWVRQRLASLGLKNAADRPRQGG